MLLITIDTLRADHLSAYGCSWKTSPRIDALADESVLFERAIAASTVTAPSHASIMTSLHTREHSIAYHNGETRLEGAVTLAEVLRDAGYATGAFVSNVVLQKRSGLDHGFDHYDDELTGAEANRPVMSERIAEQTTARALEWLEQAPEPFFLWVHYQDPHGPYSPPAPYAGRFEARITPGEQPLPVLQDNSGHRGVPAYQRLPGLRLGSEYRARYADEVFYADHWVGTLLDAVDPAGSVVVLTSDHGESLGEEGRYFVHGTTTSPQESHVPLLVRAPGIRPGRRADVVGHVDLMPTILELTSIEHPFPEDMSGLTLVPSLTSGEPLRERIVFCDMGVELGAYAGGVVLQVRPAHDAWEPELEIPRRQWRVRSWDGGEAALAEELLSEIRPRIDAYRAEAVSRAEVVVEPEFAERLRSLGYLD